MPEEGELFSGAGKSDGGQDGGMDGAAGDGGSNQFDADVDGDTGDADAPDTSDPGGDAGTGDADVDAAPQPFKPEEGLVLHYRFNETSGNAVHDFAGSKDALVVGTPVGHEQWVAAGRIGGALRLAGVTPDAGAGDGGAPAIGHHVELPQGVLLGLEQCTIALWVNRAGGLIWQRVFDLGNGEPSWLYFTAVGGTGLPVVAGRTPALIFVDYLAIPGAAAGEGQLKINQAIPVSTWVHFALTWSSAEMKVYLNGKLVAQAVTHAQVTPTDLGNTGQNYIGRSQYPADPYFNGMVDEFRIYNRALTASDVAALYELE